MVADVFESLLGELAKALDIGELRPDEHNSCLIHFQNGVEIQIEPYNKGDDLLLVADLGEVPAGRFREDVFKEALKANGLPWPRQGVFAYSDQSNHLLLYKMMPLKDLNGEKIANFMGPYLEKVQKWKESLERGDVPSVATFTTSRTGGGMFGM